MKAKELQQVWEGAETAEDKRKALVILCDEFISEVEYKIGQEMADEHEAVIRILEHVQKKWFALAHRTEGLPRMLFQRMIKNYDEKVYEAWMAKKN